MKSLISVLSMIALFFVSGQLNAAPSMSPMLPLEEKAEEVDMLKEKIIIIFIIKKKTSRGIIAEVSGLVLGDGNTLEKNTITATVELRDGKLAVRLDKSSTKIAQFIMPRGFKVSKEVSLKLGSKTSIVMSGGTTMFRGPNSLGNFEIQD